MPKDVLLRRLRTLTAFRVLFVTVLLGTFFIFRIGFGFFPYPASVLYLIILLYALTIVYSLLFGVVPAWPLAYMQLILDAIASIALILMTGGIESWFSWVLLVVVIAAAIVLNRRAAYVIATFISLLYGTALDLQFYGFIQIPFNDFFHEKDFLYKIFSHILGLYTIAYLTGHLTDRLESKGIDYEDLSRFNSEVVENMPNGLVTTDSAGRVRLFNRAAEEITGMLHSKVFGRDIRAVFPFLHDLESNREIEGALQGEHGEKIIGMRLSVIRNARGNATGHIGMMQDLTELKRLSGEVKRKESLAAVGELSARIAHEIRNPLASLKGSIEMLREGTVRPEQRERLMSIAISEMDRLDSILTDFLSYSRPSPMNVAALDIHGLINDVLDVLQNKEGVRTSIQRSYSGGLTVEGDANKLKEVFWNLCMNAVEAMRGQGTLKVSASAWGGTARIVFADTGPGIPKEDLGRIFFPFYTTKKSGTGLGLSTAYRVVEDHGGRIEVTGASGGGTEFAVIIPLKQLT